MTAVGMPPRRTVRIAVQSSAAISIATEEQQIAFASAELAEQSLSIGDGGPHAVALQRHPQFGMAFRGKELFTAVGGRQGKQGVPGEPGPAGGSASTTSWSAPATSWPGPRPPACAGTRSPRTTCS